jgi:hypothetical protein
MDFRIIFSLLYSISINTFEVDPPSDSLHNVLVKPKNREDGKRRPEECPKLAICK